MATLGFGLDDLPDAQPQTEAPQAQAEPLGFGLDALPEAKPQGSQAPLRPISQFVRDFVGMPERAPGEQVPYVENLVRRFVRDIPETTIASPLRGAGAIASSGDQPNYEGRKLESAINAIQQQGLDPAQATEQAIATTPGPVGATNPAEHSLFKAGQAVSGVLNEAIPYTPAPEGTAKRLGEDVAGGLASVAGNVGAFFVPGVGPLVATGSILFQGPGEAVDNAIQAGATPEQQVRAAQLGFGPGLLEFADLALPYLPGTTLKGVLGKLPPRAIKMLEGMFIEGGTEGVQQFLQNAIAQYVYNPQQQLSEGVVYNAVVGALTGGIAGGILHRNETPRDATPSPRPQDVQADASAVLEALRLDQPITGSPLPATTPASTVAGENIAPVAAPPGSRELGTNPRAMGTNPRALGTNPRAVGESPRQVRERLQEAEEPWSEPTAAELIARGSRQWPGEEEHKVFAMPQRELEALPDTSNARLQELGSLMPMLDRIAGTEVTSGGIGGYAVPLQAANNNPSQAEIIDSLPSPLTLEERTWQNYGRWMTPDEVLPSKAVWGGASDLVEASKAAGAPIRYAEAFAYLANGLWSRMGANKYISPALAQKYIIEQRSRGTGALQIHDAPRQKGATQSVNPLDLLPMFASIQARPGVNVARLAKLLGPQLYGDMSNIAQVSVKEMLQNSYDAVKEIPADVEAQIDITIESGTRRITVQDNGAGMTAETLGGPFLRIADTKKESDKASGGFGIAKMLYLFGNKELRVETLRDGVVSQLAATGETLFGSLDDPELAPTINTRPATEIDFERFGGQHGTIVQVTVPESYVDSGTQETRSIEFSPYRFDHPVLERSPLFRPVQVSLNGNILPVGTRFPYDLYSRFADVKFAWGTARLYVQKEPVEYVYENLHVLSNGLWQFSGQLTKNGGSYGASIPFNVFVDVVPHVKPTESGYPFELNRQGFSPTVRKDFEQILRYITLQYTQQQLESSAKNFGEVEYLDVSGSKGKVRLTPILAEQDAAAKAAQGISGKSVSVVDGQLIVDGQLLPVLTPENLQKQKLNAENLRADPKTIDLDAVMLHDNVMVEVSPVESRPIVELLREKFGTRANKYLFDLGSTFQKLRDAVVVMHRSGLEPERRRLYAGLENSVVGISFDPEYRGVSTKVPMEGVFLNPGATKFTGSPRLSAISMLGTMLHEIAHHNVRTEDNAHKVEIENLMVLLPANEPNLWQAFQAQMVEIVTQNYDIQTYLDGVFDGAVNIQPRGHRLKGLGDRSGSNEGADANVARIGAERGGVDANATGLGGSAGAASAKPGPANVSFERSTASGGSGRRGGDNGRSANQQAFDAGGNGGVPASPQQPELAAARKLVGAAFEGAPPVEVQEAAGHADRMNWLFKYAMGLHQLLAVNLNFEPLRRYYDREQRMKEDEVKVHDPTVLVLKRWRSLGVEGDRLVGFINELTNMTYRSAEEKRLGVGRYPTESETQELIAKYKITGEGEQVFRQIRGMITTFVANVEQLAVERAQGKTDKIVEIRENARLLREGRPYFPFMHFGELLVTVKDAAGNVVWWETVERQGPISAKRMQERRRRQLEAAKEPGQVVETGRLPQNFGPLVGMPKVLLEEMAEHMTFTPEQLTLLGQLQQAHQNGITPMLQPKFQKQFYVPGYSVYTPGYSLDFKRSFARYFFHGGKFLARARHIPEMEKAVQDAERAGLTHAKDGYVAQYMRDHLENTIKDARGSFGAFKGFIYLWALAFVPAAATQNLTQILFTHDFLSAKFGDIAATRALVAAPTNLSNYYARGKYREKGVTEFHLKAFGEAIEAGRITESQAAELAGMSQGNGLLFGAGGSMSQRAAVATLEKGMWMFEIAEQFLRRTTFRAALDLALKYPNAKGVKEAVAVFGPRLQRLRAKGYSEAQAKAIVAALYSVDQTQFVYERGTTPRFMRRPLPATIFVFKRFIQSLITTVASNPRDVLPRFLLKAMLVGGLAGLPGYEDIEGLLKAIAGLLDMEFSPKRILSQWVKEWLGDAVPPDMVLHGLARRGFGLPALADMMGSLPLRGTLGRGLREPFAPAQTVPYPVFDRSAAYSPGNVLPIHLGELFGPGADVEKGIAKEAQNASGAVFSVGFNMVKFLTKDIPGEPGVLRGLTHPWEIPGSRRWELIMPRALRNASKMYRAFNEGRERALGGPAGGTTVVSYDTRDTEQMMEAIGLGLGYQPLRATAKWDNTLQKLEVEKAFDMQKQKLLSEYWEATKGGRKEEIDAAYDAVTRYNERLPEWAKAKSITQDAIRKSLQTRQRNLAAREAGLPQRRSNAGIEAEIDRLFPIAPSSRVERVR